MHVPDEPTVISWSPWICPWNFQKIMEDVCNTLMHGYSHYYPVPKYKVALFINFSQINATPNRLLGPRPKTSLQAAPKTRTSTTNSPVSSRPKLSSSMDELRSSHIRERTVGHRFFISVFHFNICVINVNSSSWTLDFAICDTCDYCQRCELRTGNMRYSENSFANCFYMIHDILNFTYVLWKDISIST